MKEVEGKKKEKERGNFDDDDVDEVKYVNPNTKKVPGKTKQR